MRVRQFAVAIIVAASCVLCSAQFEHPDLKAGTRHVETLLMMPAQVEITKVGMKGPEPMIEESRQVQQSIVPVIAGVLQKEGYSLDQQGLAPAVLEKDSELRYTVDDLQKRFDEELKLMHKKSKDVRKGRFTLGDEVTKLAQGDKVDALLFVRAEAEVLTGGKKAFGWIVGGQRFDVMIMYFGVVDPRTGDVLYFAKPVLLKNLAKDPQETAGGVHKAFKNFFKASPPKTLSASGAKEAAAPATDAKDTAAPTGVAK